MRLDLYIRAFILLVLADNEVCNRIFNFVVCFELILFNFLPQFDAVDTEWTSRDLRLFKAFYLHLIAQSSPNVSSRGVLFPSDLVKSNSEMSMIVFRQEHFAVLNIHKAGVIKDERIGYEVLPIFAVVTSDYGYSLLVI